MRHRIASGLVAASLVVGAGCAWLWHQEHRSERVLVLASGPRLSEYHDFALALSRVVAALEPRLNIRVIETFGSEENMTLLTDGTAQLALVAGSTMLDGRASVVDFLFPEMFHLLARDDMGITRVPDLNGRVVGLPPLGSTSRTVFWQLIQHYGLGQWDVKAMTIEPYEAEHALRTGAIDAYFIVIALGSPFITGILSRTPTQLVPIDQAAALRLTLPALRAGEIPTGTYGGARPAPPTDLPTVAERTLLITTPAVDTDDIYDLTRIIREGRQELVSAELRAALIEPVEDPFREGVPINPGAAKYFRRDKPLFVVRYAETMGFLLSAGMLIASTLWQIKLRSDRRAKNRADNHNAKIIELTEQAQNAKNRRELDVVRQDLIATFKRVFADLDEDRITPTAIQAFTLAWFTAVQVIDHRQMILPDEPGEEMPVRLSARPMGGGDGRSERRPVIPASGEAKPAA
ncbi:MAG: TAXI family TRAP transporter solute-binding subunit [Defluviicoccus sp.]